MAPHRVLGGLGVLRFNGLEDGGVLPEREVFAPRHADAGHVVAGQPVENASDERGEKRVVGEPGDSGVELAVERDERQPPLPGGALVGQDFAQGIEVALIGALGGQPGDSTFGDQPGFLEVLQRIRVGRNKNAYAFRELLDDQIGRDLHDLGALSLRDPNRPEPLQRLQRLPDHRPRDAKSRGERALGRQAGADRKIAGVDGADKLVHHLLVEPAAHDRSQLADRLASSHPASSLARSLAPWYYQFRPVGKTGAQVGRDPRCS